jgi:hypothetical protein
MSPSKKTAAWSAAISLISLLYLLEIIPAPFPVGPHAVRDVVDKVVALVFFLSLIIAFGAAQWDFLVARKKKLLERNGK